MVAVDDEVGVAELIDDDRREADIAKRVFHLLPALAEIRAAWAEVSIEIASAAVRPDYLTYRNLAEPEVPTREGAQPLGWLVAGKQGRGWRVQGDGAGRAGRHLSA